MQEEAQEETLSASAAAGARRGIEVAKDRDRDGWGLPRSFDTGGWGLPRSYDCTRQLVPCQDAVIARGTAQVRGRARFLGRFGAPLAGRAAAACPEIALTGHELVCDQG